MRLTDFKLLSLNTERSICVRLWYVTGVRIKIIGLTSVILAMVCFNPTSRFQSRTIADNIRINVHKHEKTLANRSISDSRYSLHILAEFSKITEGLLINDVKHYVINYSEYYQNDTLANTWQSKSRCPFRSQKEKKYKKHIRHEFVLPVNDPTSSAK